MYFRASYCHIVTCRWNAKKLIHRYSYTFSVFTKRFFVLRVAKKHFMCLLELNTNFDNTKHLHLFMSWKVWEYWQWYLQETRLPVSKLAVILISLAFLLITHLHIYVQSGYIQYTQPAHLHSNHQSIINNLSWTQLLHLVLQIDWPR